MKNIIIYGIPNCDTVKKTFNWFKKNKIDFTFHNYKTGGITVSTLKNWCKKAGWQILFNNKSATWKTNKHLYEGIVNNQAEAIEIMHHHTSIIKRPVIEFNGQLIIGFDEEKYKETFIKA